MALGLPANLVASMRRDPSPECQEWFAQLPEHAAGADRPWRRRCAATRPKPTPAATAPVSSPSGTSPMTCSAPPTRRSSVLVKIRTRSCRASSPKPCQPDSALVTHPHPDHGLVCQFGSVSCASHALKVIAAGGLVCAAAARGLPSADLVAADLDDFFRDLLGPVGVAEDVAGGDEVQEFGCGVAPAKQAFGGEVTLRSGAAEITRMITKYRHRVSVGGQLVVSGNGDISGLAGGGLRWSRSTWTRQASARPSSACSSTRRNVSSSNVDRRAARSTRGVAGLATNATMASLR